MLAYSPSLRASQWYLCAPLTDAHIGTKLTAVSVPLEDTSVVCSIFVVAITDNMAERELLMRGNDIG
jgi:hypothetical protein